jgi:hypothetical protein
MKIDVPAIRAVCANPKCRHHNNDPILEINFSTQEIVYACPECGQESRLSLRNEAQPLPKTRMGRMR